MVPTESAEKYLGDSDSSAEMKSPWVEMIPSHRNNSAFLAVSGARAARPKPDSSLPLLTSYGFAVSGASFFASSAWGQFYFASSC